MATASERAESRRSADGSSSDESEPEEDEIATISDVFADMLSANEDLLLAAADYQLDSDVPSILAYQRILHRNLVEMADFVDSIFGVYNRSTPADRAEDEVAADGEGTAPGEQDDGFDVDSHDEVNGHTSEEAAEPIVKKRHPERMRSLLIDRFRLENRRRMEQRSARLWRKMRRKVRVEESVGVAMTQAAERIAQMAASAAAVHSSALELTHQPAPSNSPASLTQQPVVDAATSTDPGVATSLSQESSEADLTLDKPTQSVEAPAGPSASTTPLLSSSQPQLSVPPLQPSLHHQLSLPPPRPSSNPGGAVIMPASAGTYSKIPLPPMGSTALNLLYPIGGPPLFPPNHMSSVCADCVSLHRSAHECRSVLKHITPPPSAHPMMFNGQAMWPMLNGVIAASMTPSQPVRSVQPLRQPPPTLSSSFKKMCEDCKKHHKSVHYCRKTLGHTAPEWLAGADAEQKPRKRRSRRRKGDATVSTPTTPENTCEGRPTDPPVGLNEV